MKNPRILSMALALGLCLIILAMIVGLVDGTARAQGETIRYVAITGTDSGDCTNPDNPCCTVQYAVDTANDEDLIKVAAGTYTGVQGRPVPPGYENPPASGIITQVVYVSRSVIIRGGYTTDFLDPPDPEASPVILDAQGLGRGLAIVDSSSVTMDGLWITSGDAAGLGGGYPLGSDAGGGVFGGAATVTISNCTIYSNTASTVASGYGGGLYFTYSDARLSDNMVYGNTASNTSDGRGGGLYFAFGTAVLSGNTVQDNTASSSSNGQGGGLYLWYGSATLGDNVLQNNTASIGGVGFGGGLLSTDSSVTMSRNTVQDNVAVAPRDLDSRSAGDVLEPVRVAATVCGTTVVDGQGGGLMVFGGTATISENMIIGNTASTRTGGDGGGICLSGSTATLNGNRVQGNIASTASGPYSGGTGGGMYLGSGTVTLSDNLIEGNTASTTSIGYGGGLYLSRGDATLSGNMVRGNKASNADCGIGGGLRLGYGAAKLHENIVIGNSASMNPLATSYGGGLGIAPSSSLISTNMLVAGNQANTAGSGLWFEGESGELTSGRLAHTTIADNRGGCGQGVHVSEYATLHFTNTIISGHATGVFADFSGAASLGATLWHDNGTGTSGTGAITIGTVNIYGDPAFMHPDSANYHIAEDSAAKDAGVDAGVTVDIDGQPRPYDTGYDIGADEFHPYLVFLPLILRTGP